MSRAVVAVRRAPSRATHYPADPHYGPGGEEKMSLLTSVGKKEERKTLLSPTTLGPAAENHPQVKRETNSEFKHIPHDKSGGLNVMACFSSVKPEKWVS